MSNAEGVWGAGERYAERAESDDESAPEFGDTVSPQRRVNGNRPGLRDLIGTLEAEIIPRLMLVHSDRTPRGAASGAPERGSEPSAEQTERLVSAVLCADPTQARSFVFELIEQGVAVERLLLGLLAPAARRLGRMWEHDECSFADVTLGLCRMHQLLRELSPRLGRMPVTDSTSRRHALLLPAPGEQHMFGVLMVAEFFRRTGWDVSSGPAEPLEEVHRLVAERWFAVVGLSASTDRAVNLLAEHISSLREASRNRDLAVLVGGQAFAQRPELAREIGADATAADAHSAALHAEHLFAMMR